MKRLVKQTSSPDFARSGSSRIRDSPIGFLCHRLPFSNKPVYSVLPCTSCSWS